MTHIASGIEMYLLRGEKTLTLVKNVSRYILTEICCVARLCHVVMMSYFLGNDAISVNTFYFVGYSQPVSWCFLSEMLTSVQPLLCMLTDVKPHKYK
jgi:hypothetical protein